MQDDEGGNYERNLRIVDTVAPYAAATVEVQQPRGTILKNRLKICVSLCQGKKNSISHVDVEREAVSVVKEVVAAHIEVDQEQGKDEENLKGDFAKICWWMKNHLVGNEDDGDGFSFRKP